MSTERSIREWQKTVHALAIEKGWYDGRSAAPREILANLMLVVSELSEACEEVRAGRVQETRIEADGKPAGFAIELADAIIRILDTAQWLGVDLQPALEIKHAYNKTRPYKHGKKA